jgi:hypothetical protein
MNSQTSIISLTPDNCREYGCPCFLNPKHEAHLSKLDWLQERFAEGLTIKNLYIEGEKKAVGFIEYAPGEYAWRGVNAPDYMFIHCIWISPNKYKEMGNASLLVKDCIEHASQAGKHGVAVMTSTGAFMAKKELFLKNGFELVSTEGTSELLAYKIGKGPSPAFTERTETPDEYEGLHIVYSRQCPWVIRSIPELTEAAEQHNVAIKTTEMKTAEEARNAPSRYAAFNLIYNGKLLADRYISSTRFSNILRKDLKLIS